MDRVLDSGFLSASPKLAEFLRFIVTEEAEGRGGEINPRSIAVRALGRPESFDPRTDPVVRVFAGRLRAALASYYDGPGQYDPICITIPKGSYRPAFRLVETSTSGQGVFRDILRGGGSFVISARSAYLLAGLLAVVFVLAGGTAHYIVHRWVDGHHVEEAAAIPPAAPAGTPVVEFLPFAPRPDHAGIALVGRRY